MATGRRPDARTSGVGVADLTELPLFSVPGHSPHSFTEYLYFDDRAQRRSSGFAVTPQEALTGVVTERSAGSGLRSFARYYAWPGAVLVPVLDARRESGINSRPLGSD